MEDNKGYPILRWLVFLPASVIIYMLIFLIIPPIVKFMLDNDTFNLSKSLAFNIGRVISSIIGGYLFVVIGYKIAPQHNKKVAFIMFAILLVVSILFTYLSINSKEHIVSVMNILQVGTGFLALRQIQNEE